VAWLIFPQQSLEKVIVGESMVEGSARPFPNAPPVPSLAPLYDGALARRRD
jgi:hypothetical protein